MKSRLFALAAALLASLSGAAAAGLQLPADLPSFPAAPGVPHSYILALESDGVPLDVAKAVEVRDAFVARAASTGWKIAPHGGHATMVVHLNLSSKTPANQVHNRAIIWANFVNIYSGDEGLLAEESLSPVYIIPVAYLDYPFGYWDFAYSNFYQPGSCYRPIVRHHGHPISPICPPRTKALAVAKLLSQKPAFSGRLPAIALARDPQASLLNFTHLFHHERHEPAASVHGAGTTGLKANNSNHGGNGGGFRSPWANHSGESHGGGAGGAHSWGQGGGHNYSGGGGGGGHSWSGGGGGGGHGGGASGMGGGGGGGGGHVSGGSSAPSNGPK